MPPEIPQGWRSPRGSSWLLPLALWAVVCVVGHAFWLTRPFVNQEQVFWCAARAFVDPGFEEGFARYWREQSNPLGYSAIAAFSASALGLPLTPWSVRLPSLAGGVILLVAGWVLARELRPDEPRLYRAWAGVVTLNPLVWVYTGEATADVLPAGLAALALALAVRGRRERRGHPFAAALLAVGVLVKLNVVLIGAGVAFAVLSPDARRPTSLPARLRDLSWYAALPGASVALYAWWVHERFGHVLLPERAWHVHAPMTLGLQWASVFLTYASYLALLVGPLALLVPGRAWHWPSRRVGVLAAVGAVTAAAAEWLGRGDVGGEMGYGSFDQILPGGAGGTLRAAGIAVAVFLFADMLRRAIVDRAWCAGLVLATVVPYVALSSLSRPAQRYLLLCLPLVLFDLVVGAPGGPLGPVRKLCAATMVVFGALSVAGSAAIAANGRAAEAMTDWIESRGWIAQTDPGELRGHTGHRFPLDSPADARFVVVVGDPGASLHEERVLVFGHSLRRYSLVEKGAPSPSRR